MDARRLVTVNRANNKKSLDRDCGSESREDWIHLSNIKEAGLIKWIMN